MIDWIDYFAGVALGGLSGAICTLIWLHHRGRIAPKYQFEWECDEEDCDFLVQSDDAVEWDQIISEHKEEHHYE